jgi:hypothetical protein
MELLWFHYSFIDFVFLGRTLEDDQSNDIDIWTEEDDGDKAFLIPTCEDEYKGMRTEFDDKSQLSLAQRHRNKMNRRNLN